MRIYKINKSALGTPVFKEAIVEEPGEPIGDVWQLESSDEEAASEILGSIATQAISGDTGAQEYLSALWDGESWESILKKLQTEGSVWYVWWMDGVRAFMRDQASENQKADQQGLTPEASCNGNCNIVEAKKKEKKWIQKAVSEEDEGKFKTWCKKRGFNGVCQSCITQAIDIGGHAAKMANFAINVSKGKYHHPDKKK